MKAELKITWSIKEDKKDVLTLLLEEDVWRDVHIAIFGRQPKFPKDVSSLLEWHEIFAGLEYQAVKQYVLRRLSSQSYHSFQLKKLLRERLVQPGTIQKIIQECLNFGYLNDQAWLENFMGSQLKRSGMRAIRAKLQSKGLPFELVQEIADQWKNPAEEKKSIQRLLQTRYRSKDLTQWKEKQKVIASLARKGYSFEVIQEILKG